MKILTSMALALLVSAPALANERLIGSDVLRNGERQMSFKTRNADNLQSLKLCVRGDDLMLNKFDVEFGNGSHEQLNMRNLIRHGECTNWKNFSTGRRNVKRITIHALSGPAQRDTEVSVFGSGDKENDGADEDFGNEGGKRIGNLKLGGGNDRDREKMNGDDISQVKICVARAGARIEEFEVQFGNGERQQLNIRELFRVGQCTAWKNLNGGNRNVKEAFVRGSSMARESLLVIRGRR